MIALLLLALWAGGAICYVLGAVYDLKAGLMTPEQVLVSQHRPSLFALAVLLSAAVWPLSMVYAISIVDSQKGG